MFRTMRRKDRAIEGGACEEILRACADGVMACMGDDGYPYAVPLNYVYAGGKIICHSAREGHKIDALGRSDKVSFCVVGKHDVLAEEYSTAYQSVIVFGRARVVTDEDELVPLLDSLAAKYVTDGPEARLTYIRRFLRYTAVIEITPEHMTGKARPER